MPERPPKKWFNMMKRKVKENPKYKGYGMERINKIVAGIWYDYKESTRKRLTKKYEGEKKKKMETKKKKKAKKGKKWGKIGAPNSKKRKQFLAKVRKKKKKRKKKGKEKK